MQIVVADPADETKVTSIAVGAGRIFALTRLKHNNKAQLRTYRQANGALEHAGPWPLLTRLLVDEDGGLVYGSGRNVCASYASEASTRFARDWQTFAFAAPLEKASRVFQRVLHAPMTRFSVPSAGCGPWSAAAQAIALDRARREIILCDNPSFALHIFCANTGTFRRSINLFCSADSNQRPSPSDLIVLGGGTDDGNADRHIVFTDDFLPGVWSVIVPACYHAESAPMAIALKVAPRARLVETAAHSLVLSTSDEPFSLRVLGRRDWT